MATTTLHTASRRTLGWRGRVAAALLALASTIGVASATAQPASAADGIIYCFDNNYGQPLYLEQTRLEAYWEGVWYHVAWDRTNSNGCSFINTSAWRNYYLRVAASGINYELGGSTEIVGPGAGWYARYGVAYLRYR